MFDCRGHSTLDVAAVDSTRAGLLWNDAVIQQACLHLEDLMNRSAFLAIGPEGTGFHGQIHQVAQGDSGSRLTWYQMILVPRAHA